MIYSKNAMIGNIRTHYLEAGQGDTLILLHSGEYGANARMSWENNIESLSQHFHVYAIDMIGYGYTEKLYSFENVALQRIRHITEFLRSFCIENAYFAGNSLGGGLILSVAAQENPVWPIKKILTISGGGANNPEAHELLGKYDCTKEFMKKIVEMMFVNEPWTSEAYIEKKYRESLIPGHWEALSAARLKSPVAEEKPLKVPDYGNVKVPVLICAGDRDLLKLPDYADKLQASLSNSRVETFKNCGHCAHIEYAESFNQLAVDFFKNG
jgi:2-hydroxymuconate-semialdehyde hydrolase